MSEELKHIKHAITLLQKAVAQLEGRLDVDTPKKQTGFRPPTWNEAQIYYLGHHYHFDLVKWFNHYQSNGWKVGGNAMKDWHAAMVTWERSWQEKNPERKTVRLDAHGRPLKANGQERLL